MERDRIAKIVYVGECAGNRSVCRSWKRWIDTVKKCLKKRGLNVSQARRRVQDRSEWQGFFVGEYMGRCPGDEPLTLTRCHSCGLPQLYEALEGWKSVCGRVYNLKGIKGKFSVFLLFLKL